MSAKKEDLDLERCCVFCEHGITIPTADRLCDDVLCAKKGIVAGDYVCRRFRYDPLKRDPKEKRPLPETEAILLDD